MEDETSETASESEEVDNDKDDEDETTEADDEAVTPVAVVNDVTSQEEGTITEESKIKSKTGGIEFTSMLICHQPIFTPRALRSLRNEEEYVTSV